MLKMLNTENGLPKIKPISASYILSLTFLELKTRYHLQDIEVFKGVLKQLFILDL